MAIILIKTFIRTFYRQHAEWFLFIFLFFFGLIAPSMQLAYHYALIRGMLETPALMALVWLAWLVYTLQLVRFVEGILASPDHLFLQKLRLRQRKNQCWRGSNYSAAQCCTCCCAIKTLRITTSA